MTSQLQQVFVFEDPGHDAVHVAGKHSGHVRDGLPRPHAHFLLAQIKGVAAQLLDAHLEADSRPERGFLE